MEISNLYDDLSSAEIQERATPVGQQLRVTVTKTSAQGKAAQSATPNLMSFSTDENSIWFNGKKYSTHLFKNKLHNLSTSSSHADITEALNGATFSDIKDFVARGIQGAVMVDENPDYNLLPVTMQYSEEDNSSVVYFSIIYSNHYITDISIDMTSSSAYKVKEVLSDTLLLESNVINSLASQSIVSPLSAAMGKKLNDEKLAKTDVVNSLSDSSTNKALSAAQGKALNDKISALGSVYRIKGSKTNISEVLALTDAKVGDAWNVTNAFTFGGKPYPANTNVVCITATSASDHDENNWDPIGGTVDLSGVTSDEEFNELVAIVDNLSTTKIDKTDIVNNLTSTNTDKPLSAAMGKKLQDEKLSKTEANDTYAKKSDVSYTTDLPDSLVVPQTIGGINKGTKVSDLEGSTISQMFDNLLFPEVQPTIQAPSATISFKDTFSSNGVYEVGATAPTAANFNTSFNRGTCTVVGQANKNRAGNLDSGNSFIYYGGNTSTTTLPAKVTLGTMQYNYHAAYAQGDTLVTSKGNKASVTPNPLPAGSVNSSNLTIFGTYPYYCNGQNASSSSGDSNFPTSATPDTKLPLYKWTNTLVGAKFASEAATGTRMQFMYSSRKNVTKVEFYNTISGKWETFSTSNYNAKSGTKTYSVQGTNETYNILTTTGPLSGSVQYRFTMANA